MSNLQPYTLFTVDQNKVSLGWNLRMGNKCPLVDSPKGWIFFPDHDMLKTPVVEKVLSGVNQKTFNRLAYPFYGRPNQALVLVKVRKDPRGNAKISLPYGMDVPCDYQDELIDTHRAFLPNWLGEDIKGLFCTECGADLVFRYIKGYATYYVHPKKMVYKYHFPFLPVRNMENKIPFLLESGSSTDYGEFLLEVKPGQAFRTMGENEEFFLYGTDGVFYRSDSLKDIEESGLYNINQILDYLAEIEKTPAEFLLFA